MRSNECDAIVAALTFLPGERFAGPSRPARADGRSSHWACSSQTNYYPAKAPKPRAIGCAERFGYARAHEVAQQCNSDRDFERARCRRLLRGHEACLACCSQPADATPGEPPWFRCWSETTTTPPPARQRGLSLLCSAPARSPTPLRLS